MTAGTGERASDADLAARFLQDPELFTEVHDRYFAAIYRYVAGRLDAQTAEDITAETFLVAFDRRSTFDAERGALRVWLFGLLLPQGYRLVVDPATGRVNGTSVYVTMDALYGLPDPASATISAEWTNTLPA